MSVHPTTNPKITRGLALAGVALSGLAFSATASAAVTETVVAGNPKCADIGAGFTEVKIDPVPQGQSKAGNDRFTVDVNGLYFDWTSTEAITTVIVKGGNNATIYKYDPAATSGTGLHAPINPNNNKPYGLSHISFCTGNVPPPPVVTPTPTPTETPTPGPCEPGGPTTNTDGTPCTPGDTPPGNTPPGDTPPGDTPPGGTTPGGGTSPTTTTTGQPASGVLGDETSGGVTPGSARLSAPSSCISRYAKVTVRGRKIRKVVFYVNGRKIKVVRNSGRVYTARIRVKGAVRVQARVTFTKASKTRARTLRTALVACDRPASAIRPQFTG